MLTDLGIKKLPTPESRREVPDGRVDGSYLVVQPSGAKSWAVPLSRGRHSEETDAQAPIPLLTSPRPGNERRSPRRSCRRQDPGAAKQAARRLPELSARPTRPRRARRRSFIERTSSAAAGSARAGARRSSASSKSKFFRRIGDKRIGDVKKRDINDILDAIADRGSPITANRCFAVLRKFFNWARDDRDLIAVSPCAGVTARTEERSRDRVLGDEEISLAWRAFDAIGWPFGPIGKLLLLTGARRSEIAEASWQEIDLAAKTLTLPGSRTKNDKPHVIPLSDDAVEIIKALPRIEGKAGLVFSTTGATPVSGFSRSGRRSKGDLAGLRKAATARGEDPGKVEAPRLDPARSSPDRGDQPAKARRPA